jgi:prepilin-type N-terminal cleavage/methylation domain-containing protein
MTAINKKAFTLIELLVVVLIIGILAAIALPQYTKTVRLSRTSEAVTMLNAIMKGQEEYFLIYSDYTNDINELSITVPSGKLSENMSENNKKSNYYYVCWEKRVCGAFIDNEDYPIFEFAGLHKNNDIGTAHRNVTGKRFCSVQNDSVKSRAICEIMGTLDPTSSNRQYILK